MVNYGGGGYTRTSQNSRDYQPVAITSVDVTARTASGYTRGRTLIDIDISQHVGAVQVTPVIGDQWMVEKEHGVYKLTRKIPFNTAEMLVQPTQGQVQLGSTSGPIELNGNQVNINAPTFRLGTTLYRDNDGTLEYQLAGSATWVPVAAGGSVTIDPDWADIIGKPTTFPPTVPIDWADIDDTPATFPSSWTTITGKPTFFSGAWTDLTGVPSTFPPTPPTGTPDGTKFWRDDDTWAVPPGGGGGGAGINIVTGEVPTGSINGSNLVFTLASTYNTGSTMVYLNGIRCELGLDYTETTGHTITFSTAPSTGDDLRVDYVIPGLILSLIAGEAPSGTKNGINLVFTLTQDYLTTTTSVFRNGLREQLSVGYTESGSATITFTTAPLSSDIVTVDYLATS